MAGSRQAAALVRWAVAAAQDGDHAAAVHFLQEALELDASCVDAWLWLAELLEDRAEAVRCLVAALHLDPSAGHRRPRLRAAWATVQHRA